MNTATLSIDTPATVSERQQAGPLTFRAPATDNPRFFPVGEAEVLYEAQGLSPFRGKKVIVNRRTGQGISIVNDGFVCVPHEDAFRLGAEIFELLFGRKPEVGRESLSPRTTDYSVDLISSRCKIVIDRLGYRYENDEEEADLFHRSHQRKADEMNTLEPRDPLPAVVETFRDEYHPFIRVSNYLRNGQSLQIEMGYYRYRCSNGMIYGLQTKLVFRRRYSNTSIRAMRLEALDHFRAYRHRFLDMAGKLWNTLRLPVSPKAMREVVFDLYFDEVVSRNPEERRRLAELLHGIVEKYRSEIGDNLNAALNVATEFAQQLETARVSQSPLQAKGARWLNRVSRRSFNLDAYLISIRGSEERAMQAKKKEEEDQYDELEINDAGRSTLFD